MEIGVGIDEIGLNIVEVGSIVGYLSADAVTRPLVVFCLELFPLCLYVVLVDVVFTLFVHISVSYYISLYNPITGSYLEQ